MLLRQNYTANWHTFSLGAFSKDFKGPFHVKMTADGPHFRFKVHTWRPALLRIRSRLNSCIGYRPLEQKTLGFQFLCLFATAINWRFVSNFIHCWWMLQGEKYCCFLLQILRCWQVAMSLVQTVKVLKMIPVLIATWSNVDISSMFRTWKPWIVNFWIMWTDKGAKSTCTQGWQSVCQPNFSLCLIMPLF